MIGFERLLRAFPFWEVDFLFFCGVKQERAGAVLLDGARGAGVMNINSSSSLIL